MNNRTIVRQPHRANSEEPATPVRPQPLLISALDAALVLGIGRTTLYELVRSGDLTPIHVRRCVRFSMYEIEQFVESLRRAM